MEEVPCSSDPATSSDRFAFPNEWGHNPYNVVFDGHSTNFKYKDRRVYARPNHAMAVLMQKMWWAGLFHELGSNKPCEGCEVKYMVLKTMKEILLNQITGDLPYPVYNKSGHLIQQDSIQYAPA